MGELLAGVEHVESGFGQHRQAFFRDRRSQRQRRKRAPGVASETQGERAALLVRRGDRTSTLPQHGGRKQLGKGLWLKILKDLDLKE